LQVSQLRIIVTSFGTPNHPSKEDVMLAEFFDSPLRIQELRDGPDGHLLEGFAQELCQAGYAEITARRHIRAAEHLIYWTGRKGRTVAALDERMIEEFVQHLNRCRCPRYGRTHRRDLRKGARLFLRYARFADLVTTRVVEEIIVDPALLVAFCGWMRQQRGTCDATLYNYSLHVRDLLKSLGEDPDRFNAQSLRQFVLDTSQRCGWAAAKKCTTAIRMFLRFLIADGKCAAGLDSSIPVLAHWRLSSLPRYLQSDEVERVIASCDPATPMGKRDRAILLLLARLGLRAGDIVHLGLGDVDWKEAGICVSGKGRRQTLMPLTQEIGDVIASYIKDGRPQTTVDTLFVRSRAPFRALANHCAISMIVARAMRRAGVTCPSRGAAHVLRHSVASSMLRQGSSLQEIAAVLRHRSIATTEIYAKVDVVTLRQIVQPWPEVKSC
jgi:integrase/recombinase XerD